MQMNPRCHELTLANMLTDPMVRIAMAADRVDPQELATMLAAVARTLKVPPPLAAPVGQFVFPN